MSVVWSAADGWVIENGEPLFQTAIAAIAQFAADEHNKLLAELATVRAAVLSSAAQAIREEAESELYGYEEAIGMIIAAQIVERGAGGL